MCISYHESIMKGRPVGIAIASGFPTTHASVQVSRAPRRIPECLHLSSQGPYTHLVFQLNRFLLQFPVHAGPRAAPCGRYHPLSHCNQRHTDRFDVVSSSVNIPRLAAALRDHPDCSLVNFLLYGCLRFWSGIQGAYHSWSSQEFTLSSFSPQGGHTAGTFGILPLPVLHVSPFGTVKNTHHITSSSHHPGSFFSPWRICQWWHQQTWVLSAVPEFWRCGWFGSHA